MSFARSQGRGGRLGLSSRPRQDGRQGRPRGEILRFERFSRDALHRRLKRHGLQGTAGEKGERGRVMGTEPAACSTAGRRRGNERMSAPLAPPIGSEAPRPNTDTRQRSRPWSNRLDVKPLVLPGVHRRREHRPLHVHGTGRRGPHLSGKVMPFPHLRRSDPTPCSTPLRFSWILPPWACCRSGHTRTNSTPSVWRDEAEVSRSRGSACSGFSPQRGYPSKVARQSSERVKGKRES